MADEEDYMSDKFLTGLSEVRPSLIKSHAQKRKLEMTRKQEVDLRRQREERLERSGANANERLQESLKRPIAPENKGFQLLAKMGYKPGQALGKETSATDCSYDKHPCTEPIKISIKSDRGGLGREAALRELAEKRQRLRQQHLLKATGVEQVSAEEYRKRAMLKAQERFMHGALRRCQLSCENLDSKAGIEKPEIVWFWPERPKEVAADDDAANDDEEEANAVEVEEDQLTDTEKFELLYGYLRTAYTFCYWCGVCYKDKDDLDSNCPGLTRDDH